MPLYEYQCDACERRFELIRKFSDPPVTACPTCGGPVEKLVSSPAFQFKGTGWYVTDYARKPGADQAEAGRKEGAAGNADGKPQDKGKDAGEKGAKEQPQKEKAAPAEGKSDVTSERAARPATPAPDRGA